jgi:cytochrome c biogenesis protein CcmG/thiol:disulfide interchange protein DsbE
MKPWQIVVVGLVFALLGIFYFGLGRDPREIPSPLIGRAAPAFIGETPEGAPYPVTAHAGKVVLVTFWATWCTTCRADEPLIEAIHNKFKSNPDFALVGVATQDERSGVQAYLAKGHRPYLNLFDAKGKLAIDFGVYGVPETFLIDRSGKVLDKIPGAINVNKLSAQIDEALKGGRKG